MTGDQPTIEDPRRSSLLDGGPVPPWLINSAALGWRIIAIAAFAVALLAVANVLWVVTASIAVSVVVAAVFAPAVTSLRARGRSRNGAALIGLGRLVRRDQPCRAGVGHRLRSVLAPDPDGARRRADEAEHHVGRLLNSAGRDVGSARSLELCSNQHGRRGGRPDLINRVGSHGRHPGHISGLLPAPRRRRRLALDVPGAWTTTSRQGHERRTRRARPCRWLPARHDGSGRDHRGYRLHLHGRAGTPLALSLAMLVFLGGYIPYVGGAVTTLIIVLVTFSAQGSGAAIALLVLIAIRNLAVGYGIRPTLYGKTVTCIRRSFCWRCRPVSRSQASSDCSRRSR